MTIHPFMQIDAFTDRPLGGNPCAVVFNCAGVAESILQAVALEMNLSETAFVLEISPGVIRVRYFTPSEEIPFAGHPTIATTYAVLISGQMTLRGEVTRIYLETKIGRIPVDIYSHQGKIGRIVMTQRSPQYLGSYPPEEIMPVFGLQAQDLLPGYLIQTVSTGTPQLMVPLRDHDALKRATLQINAYAQLRERADFFSPHLFCLGGATPEGDTFARHFGLPPDTLEDPFTGSATGGMAAYLWRYGLIDKAQFIAQQGHWMNRPGQAVVEVIGPRHDIAAIRVGGYAITVITGELILP